MSNRRDQSGVPAWFLRASGLGEDRARYALHAIWLFVASIAAALLNFGFQMMAGRMLGHDAFGTMNLMLAAAGIAGIPISALSMAVVRYSSISSARGDQSALMCLVRRLVVHTSLFVAAMLLFLLVTERFWLSYFDLSTRVPLCAAFLVLATMLFIPVSNGPLLGSQSFFWAGTRDQVAALSRLVMGALLILLGFSAVGGILGRFFENFVRVLVSAWALRHLLFSQDARKVQVFRVYRFFVPALICTGTVTFISNYDMFAIRNMLGEQGSSDYLTASVIARTVLYCLVPFTTMFFPRIVGKLATRRSPRLELFIVMGMSCAVMVAAVIGLFFFGGFAITLMKGEGYDAAAKILPKLAFALTPLAMLSLLSLYILAVGHVPSFVCLLLSAAVYYGVLTFGCSSVDGIIRGILYCGWGSVVLVSVSVLTARTERGLTDMFGKDGADHRPQTTDDRLETGNGESEL